MRASRLAPIALALALSACGGGGGSGAPAAPISAPFVPSTGIVPISFTVSSTASPATTVGSVRRTPDYVSPGTSSIAIYDGTTLIYVGNPVTPPNITTVYANSGQTTVVSGSCTSGTAPTCTLNVQATLGAHTFDVIMYPVAQTSANTSTPPAFSGVILSEGELAVTVVSGTNPAQTIVPLGVADRAVFSGPALTQRVNGTLVGIIGTTYTIQYAIDDSAAIPMGFQIVQPGAYDNGPVTIGESDGGGIVTMTPVSQSSPPASAGYQSFTVTCQNSGTATITAAAKTKPNTAYASGLTYSANNYPTGTLGTTTLQCAPGSATLPVTVQ